MSITIQEINADKFALYDGIPTWFEVKSMFRVEAVEAGLGGFKLVKEEVVEPFIRDSNSQHEDHPTHWASHFDIGRWRIFLATDDVGQHVGGAAVALDAPVYPMDRFQRQDLAVLWDLRVHPEYRKQGIGSQLFKYAVDWARSKGYGQLGMETNSSNVAACRFYARQGCEFGAIHRFGYIGVPEVAHYAMLLWYLDL
jgi:streptothricin acetyltransferase